MKSCYRCNAAVADNAITCPACGAIQPLHPPSPPPVISANKPTAGINPWAAAYTLFTGVFSIGYIIFIILSRFNWRYKDLLSAIWVDLINIAAVIIIAILLFTRRKPARILFLVWGSLFFLAQLFNWIIPGMTAGLTVGEIFPHLLWTLATTTTFIILSIRLFKKAS